MKAFILAALIFLAGCGQQSQPKPPGGAVLPSLPVSRSRAVPPTAGKPVTFELGPSPDIGASNYLRWGYAPTELTNSVEAITISDNVWLAEAIVPHGARFYFAAVAIQDGVESSTVIYSNRWPFEYQYEHVLTASESINGEFIPVATNVFNADKAMEFFTGEVRRGSVIP